MDTPVPPKFEIIAPFVLRFLPNHFTKYPSDFFGENYGNISTHVDSIFRNRADRHSRNLNLNLVNLFNLKLKKQSNNTHKIWITHDPLPLWIIFTEQQNNSPAIIRLQVIQICNVVVIHAEYHMIFVKISSCYLSRHMFIVQIVFIE